MTDHLSFELLCDLADGDLDAAAESSARAHVQACEECASRLSSLSALGESTDALPREIAPPDGLWKDIRAELKPRRAFQRERAFVWRMRHLAAAAVVIAIGSSALTALMMREQRTPLPQKVAADPQPPATALPARLASAEHGYTRSVEVLQRALARDPANRALAALFASNYERKIDLLRRATELAPRT